MKSRASSLIAAGLMAIVLTCATRLSAGPPLICHSIEIGQAQTLPWVDLNYHKGDGSYNLQNLAKDTIAILDSNPAVLVRMETLRRATLYARQDPQAAKELLTRLRARATEAPSDARGALTWFDFGYLTEAYKQWSGNGEPSPAAGVDGYAWVKRAIQERGNDPEMEFAAALIHTHRAERGSSRARTEGHGGSEDRCFARTKPGFSLWRGDYVGDSYRSICGEIKHRLVEVRAFPPWRTKEVREGGAPRQTDRTGQSFCHEWRSDL